MAENSCTNGVELDEEGEEISMYRKSAVSVVNFKIIYSIDDIQSRKAIHFKPEMAHQVFGESENVFGYHTVSITLHYLHNSSHCYADVQKSGEIRTSLLYTPDDIMKCLKPWLPKKFTTSASQFSRMIKREEHDFMFGSLIYKFKDKLECKHFPNQNILADYKITFCDIKDEDFKEFHKRFETFIVWFIDAANVIDLTDERWMIYYVYEEFQDPKTKKLYRSPVGYCSVYRFYSYPESVRTRISQFFILPSHQRRGIGTHLYQAVVNHIRTMPEAVDITVEEPTTRFQKIRDYVDCLSVRSELADEDIDINTGNQKVIFQLMRQLKLCKRQCQRIYDILRCYYAGKTGAFGYQTYIKSIKARIKSDIERETRGSKRLCNLERIGVVVERPDRASFIESDFKKYVEDIEPSVKYLQLHLVDTP